MSATKALKLVQRDADVSRFWAKVGLPDVNGCMLWLPEPRTAKGYGKFSVVSSDGRYADMNAHRYSCFLANGEPPKPDLDAAHGCTTKDCVAPAHLYWATRVRNMADKHRDGTEQTGERHGSAKLTEQDVLEIYSSTERGVDLAAHYGITPTAITHIRKGRTWTHITRKDCA